MYRVLVHRRAARYLQRLPQPKKERIKNVLAKVALDPFHGPDVRAMVGQWAGFITVFALAMSASFSGWKGRR